MKSARRHLWVDPLGALLTALAAAALAGLPLLLVKANRIVPGAPRALLESLPPWLAAGVAISLAVAAAAALWSRSTSVRLIVALAAFATYVAALGNASSALTPVGNRVVRVALGSGSWIVLVALALLAIDALARLRLPPVARVAALACALTAAWLALASGLLDQLSVMREYSAYASRFGPELAQHLRLALGSLAAALAIGLPLGVACHRQPHIRAATLPVLSAVQTVPSIALFGILIAPLAALAAAYPALARFGISGIGAAPATIALFLYALLPVVANTMTGLARVDPAAVDAAEGMGLTPGQVLRQVEFPLALPTILAGIRIVLVQNIGLVTVAALIGGGGLGTFIFQGIGQSAIDLVLLGAIPTVVLACSATVVLDAMADHAGRASR